MTEGLRCPLCGGRWIFCRSTQRHGKLTVRYYRCRECGARLRLISSPQRSWWKWSRQH